MPRLIMATPSPRPAKSPRRPRSIFRRWAASSSRPKAKWPPSTCSTAERPPACAAMTASSGPGISLMQEGFSYLAGAELPCVIADIMRAGPGLGNIAPEQGDYNQVVKGGGHGNYRNLVLAPASVQEMADFTSLAFDLADAYRNPVVVLADANIGQMMEPVALRRSPPRFPRRPTGPFPEPPPRAATWSPPFTWSLTTWSARPQAGSQVSPGRATEARARNATAPKTRRSSSSATALWAAMLKAVVDLGPPARARPSDCSAPHAVPLPQGRRFRHSPHQAKGFAGGGTEQRPVGRRRPPGARRPRARRVLQPHRRQRPHRRRGPRLRGT